MLALIGVTNVHGQSKVLALASCALGRRRDRSRGPRLGNLGRNRLRSRASNHSMRRYRGLLGRRLARLLLPRLSWQKGRASRDASHAVEVLSLHEVAGDRTLAARLRRAARAAAAGEEGVDGARERVPVAARQLLQLSEASGEAPVDGR